MLPNSQLWSLYDMLRFYAATFTSVMSNLVLAEARIAFHGISHSSDDPLPPEALDEVITAISAAAGSCDELPFSLSLREQIKRLSERVGSGLKNDIEKHVSISLIQETRKNIVIELSGDLFFQVPASDKWMFLNPEEWFGEDVVGAFPDAQGDMRDCARCIALNQWTASVFHAMLIVEHGLRWFAGELGVSFEQQQWGVVIDQIHAAIKKLKQGKKTPERDDQIEFFSDLAAHFFHFKEAWRNRVSHGHRRYDEEDGRRIATHVRDFMAAIAAKAST